MCPLAIIYRRNPCKAGSVKWGLWTGVMHTASVLLLELSLGLALISPDRIRPWLPVSLRLFDLLRGTSSRSVLAVLHT